MSLGDAGRCPRAWGCRGNNSQRTWRYLPSSQKAQASRPCCFAGRTKCLLSCGRACCASPGTAAEDLVMHRGSLPEGAAWVRAASAAVSSEQRPLLVACLACLAPGVVSYSVPRPLRQLTTGVAVSTPSCRRTRRAPRSAAREVHCSTFPS